MAEILGNELLIKALGKKGWTEVKCVCVCGGGGSSSDSTRQRHNDTSQALSVAPQIHTSRNEAFAHSCTHPAPSDVHGSRTDRGIA